MGCTATFTISEAILGETPLDDACYVPAPVDKIFGTIGPHLVKFNAATGVRESFVRIVGPAYGTCRLCYHAPLGLIYVSIWNIPNNQWITVPPWSARGLYPINPTTMAVGAVLDIWSQLLPDGEWPNGPRHVFSAGGTYLYFVWGKGDAFTGVNYYRINPLNLADNFTPTWAECTGGAIGFNQLATDGSNIYAASPTYYEIQKYNLNLTNVSYDYCSIVGPEQYVDNPVSVAWSSVNSKPYAVCGTGTLIRVDDFVGAGGNYTALTMNVASVPTMPAGANPRPVRFRYRSSDDKLYIPCQADNGIIVWDPLTETGDWKSGFDAPIDVVFTASKAFAVQHGITGLKEIT